MLRFRIWLANIFLTQSIEKLSNVYYPCLLLAIFPPGMYHPTVKQLKHNSTSKKKRNTSYPHKHNTFKAPLPPVRHNRMTTYPKRAKTLREPVLIKKRGASAKSWRRRSQNKLKNRERYSSENRQRAKVHQ